jgi:hypothetical protein
MNSSDFKWLFFTSYVFTEATFLGAWHRLLMYGKKVYSRDPPKIRHDYTDLSPLLAQ